jgi:amidase
VSADDLARAARLHDELLSRARVFFESFEFFACAVNQVPPFDADLDWPKTIDGGEMDTYTSWMKSAYWVSVLGGPAISVPCGFSTDDMPIGIQLVGRRGDDRRLLELARSFESARGTGKRRPNLVTLS